MTAKPRKPLLVNLTWAGILVFVFGPILYVLAVGPVVKLKNAGYFPDDGFADRSITAAYRPLRWAYENSPAVETLLNSYLSLWIDLPFQSARLSDVQQWIAISVIIALACIALGATGALYLRRSPL
jgi:hypothetical protein